MIKKDFDKLMNYRFNLKPTKVGEHKDDEGNTYYTYTRDKGLQPLAAILYAKDIEDDESAKAVLNTIKRKLELGEF